MPIMLLVSLCVTLLDVTGMGLNDKLYRLLYVPEEGDPVYEDVSEVTQEFNDARNPKETVSVPEFNLGGSATMATNDEVLEALSKIHVKR